MLDFDTYVSRLGEFGVQALVERLERYEGVCSSVAVPLEERWKKLMASNGAFGAQQQLAA